MADEKITLELETKGSEVIKKLQEDLDLVGDELKRVTQEFLDGSISEGDYLERTKELRESIKLTTTQIKELGGSVKSAKSGMAGFGQSMLQTGRVVQDFAQGGLGGILNNIEGFTQAIGGGPGLAGAFTVLGVAILLVKPYLQDFFDSFKSDEPHSFGEELDELEGKIKKLTEKKHKLAIDYEDLQKAKEQLDEMRKIENEIKALRDANTSEESKQKKAVQTAITEGGKEESVEKGLLASGKLKLDQDQKYRQIQQKIEDSSKEIQRLKSAEDSAAQMGFDSSAFASQIADQSKTLKTLQALANQRKTDLARELIVGAETDPKKLDEMIGIVKTNPKLFNPALAPKLDEATPEHRRKIEADKKAKEDAKKAQQDAKLADEQWASEQAMADAELDQSNAQYKKAKANRNLESKHDQEKRLLDHRQKEAAVEKKSTEMEKDLGNRLERDLLSIGSITDPKARRKLKSQGMSNLTRELRRRGVPAEQSYDVAEKMVSKAEKSLDSKISAQKQAFVDQGLNPIQATQQATIATMSSLNSELAKIGQTQERLRTELSKIQRDVRVRRPRS